MHPDLQHLIRLQQLETEIETARRRILEIPIQQQALDARLAEQTALVDAVKARLAASQTARRDIEKDVAAIQTRLSKYKEQLMGVKTNKEYQAMQKEIATAEEGVRGHEDTILERMEEAEAIATELKTAEAELKRQQGDIAAEKRRLDAEAGSAQQIIDARLADRGGVAAQLSAPALRLFEHVASQRKGLAIAEARDGVCCLCHVRLRPQIYSQVRRGEDLIQCESCLRILYFLPQPAAQSS